MGAIQAYPIHSCGYGLYKEKLMIELYELPAPLGSCLGCSPPADFSVWQRFSLSFGSSSPGPASSKRTTPRHSGSGLPPAAFFHHHHGSAQSSWSTPPSTSQRGAVQAEVQWIAAWAVERGAGSGAGRGKGSGLQTERIFSAPHP